MKLARPSDADIRRLDSQANAYTIKALRITAVAFLVVWLLNMLGVFIVDRGLMSCAFGFGTALMLVPSLICRYTGTRRPWVKYMLMTFVCAATTVICTLLSFHAVLLFALPLFYAAQYSDRKVIHFAYALTVVSVFISVMGGYYWGICDANFLIMSNNTTAHYFNFATNELNFAAMTPNLNPWATLPLYVILPRCIILAVFVPVIRKISGNISKSAATAARLHYISETDKATRFYNRSKFQEMVANYYPRIDRIAVIFWDINNLKMVNDTYGHAYGDTLITSIAACIYELADGRRNVFRLGGDEFVMLLEGGDVDRVDALLKRWRELLAAERRESALPLSVAVGSAVGVGRDVDQLVARADAAMYRDKRRSKRAYAG